MDGVGEVRDLMKRFEEVNMKFADPDADMDALLAEQAALQEKIDACNGWELERMIEIAMDALRLPPGRCGCEQTIRRRETACGVVPLVVIQTRYVVVGRTDQPFGCGIGGMASNLFEKLCRHGCDDYARPVFLG